METKNSHQRPVKNTPSKAPASADALCVALFDARQVWRKEMK
ncbi:hypothetical protein ACQZN0_000223 [Escherichia coli]|nr:hypothetical protein [Escherichia coli]MED0146347.1 hypothetical protein [Escherichia coli]MED8824540.1 hypothetical protein [Escherichia coli]